MGPNRNPRMERKNTEGYVIVSTCGSEQDTLYKIIYAKMCIGCKTMCFIPHSLLAIFHI